MGTFLTAEWRRLIMAQYEVDPQVLAPYLPGGLELDLYEYEGRARCYVSLVGFLFTRVRIKGLPPPFHTHFEEVNLRFYVKRPLPPVAGRSMPARRGVVFVSEIVPRFAITAIARALYGEAYRTAATRSAIAATPDELRVRYDWRIPRKPHRALAAGDPQAWQHLSVVADAQPQEIARGSTEEFITEHYWGYTQHTGLVPRAGATGEYGVAHPRWQCYPIRSVQVQADFGALYGPEFAHLNGRAPDHVLLAEGSPIAIRSGSHFTP